jgi:hypothetical protein
LVRLFEIKNYPELNLKLRITRSSISVNKVSETWTLTLVILAVRLTREVALDLKERREEKEEAGGD